MASSRSISASRGQGGGRPVDATASTPQGSADRKSKGPFRPAAPALDQRACQALSQRIALRPRAESRPRRSEDEAAADRESSGIGYGRYRRARVERRDLL